MAAEPGTHSAAFARSTLMNRSVRLSRFHERLSAELGFTSTRGKIAEIDAIADGPAASSAMWSSTTHGQNLSHGHRPKAPNAHDSPLCAATTASTPHPSAAHIGYRVPQPSLSLTVLTRAPRSTVDEDHRGDQPVTQQNSWSAVPPEGPHPARNRPLTAL